MKKLVWNVTISKKNNNPCRGQFQLCKYNIHGTYANKHLPHDFTQGCYREDSDLFFVL